MNAVAQPAHGTYAEYLALERDSSQAYEYLNGLIYVVHAELFEQIASEVAEMVADDT